VEVRRVAKQNLTVSLDAGVIRKARILAAKRGSSISQMVSQTIDELISKTESYETARACALELMQRGFRLGKSRRVSRDDLHERR
jgi:uncharacterized protein DUF6364